ncbi:MAG: MFS transporter [Chloroflexota bacterium]
MTPPMPTNLNQTPYRWYILGLAAFTFTFSMAMQLMALPVLFQEISDDLQLTLVQVGAIWGMGSLTGILTGLVGGSIGDRFGAKRTLTVLCFLAGLAGVSRGFATDFFTFSLAVFFFGLVTPAIPMNVHKTCGIWFPGRNLGLANGVVSAGMALGFMIASLISATLVSPWLGGWRNVLFLYGVISMLMSIPWALSRDAMSDGAHSKSQNASSSMKQTFLKIMRLRPIWLFGLAIFGINGCIQGTLGYLPLYLRNIGWPIEQADGALAMFHATSLIATIPISLLSDRLGSRKKILILAAIMSATGVGLLSVVNGLLVWGAVIIAGLFRDGFMAIFMTAVIEIEGVGGENAGTATGLIMVFLQLGTVLAPPIGNSLARFAPNVPFVFWMAFALIGLACLYLIQEKNASQEAIRH